MPPDLESVSLPDPPQPRPAARDAAIDAALRRFDGVDEPVATAPRPSPWTRRPQFQLAVAASLVLVIGIPATLIGLRDQDSGPVSIPPPAAPAPQQSRQSSADAAANVGQPVPGPIEANPRPPVVAPPSRSVREVTAAPAILPPVNAAPAAPAAQEQSMGYAAPAPAPPPPAPPPSAGMVAQKSAEARAGDVMITGTRIPQPNLTSASPVTVLAERDEIAAAPDFVQKDRAYASFLERLQGAVRSNNRRAVIRLIQLPLRVNFNGGSRLYRDAASVRANYDRIFTPNVRQAILGQKAKELFGRDQGAMIGSGQVWFDHSCPDTSCSPPGPVRITAVNP
jgi:hypothetical protein